MRLLRLLFFFLLVGLGLFGGIYYARELNPVELVETNLSTLRIDYKSDYVLMVAETFSVQNQKEVAYCQLAALGGLPEENIEMALVFGVENAFEPKDLVLINQLYTELENFAISGLDCP